MYNRRYFIVVVFLVFSLGTTGTINATPNSDLEILRDNLETVNNNILESENTLQKLDDEISINKIKSSQLEVEINLKNSEIKDKEVELKKSEGVLSDRLRSSYECFDSSLDYIEFLLNSKSLHDLTERKAHLEHLVKADRDLIDSVKNAKEELENSRTVLLESQKEYEQLTSDLESQMSSSKELLDKLVKDKDSISLQINVNEERVVKPLIDLIDSTNSKSGLVALKNSFESINSGIMTSETNQLITNALNKINEKITNLDRVSPIVGGISPIPTNSIIINEAYKYLGIPYVWGGSTPSEGLDCSGLIQWVYSQCGYTLTRTTYTQVNEGVSVQVDLNQLKAGDLIFFGDASAPHHVALYIGNNYYIHAPHTGDVVRISYGADKACCARRIIP